MSDLQEAGKRIEELEARELELMRQVISLQNDIIILKNQQLPWPDSAKPANPILPNFPPQPWQPSVTPSDWPNYFWPCIS